MNVELVGEVIVGQARYDVDVPLQKAPDFQ
jgi:hypothetical protein